ncbi:MAG: CoB--CoM heterodisulfide reductase subunit B [Candidatus Hecatellales archaeon]|nr:MAG: CoB--CoM heterodisulfide reductase subunit B [Candidatus Hecatellales archaeon]
MKYSFFLGCIAPLRYPGLEAATRLLFKELGIELLDLKGASCCPAPGVFGSFDLWNWLLVAARNLSIAEEQNVDAMVICNGCYATLQEAYHLLGKPERLEAVNKVLSQIGRNYQRRTGVKHVVEVLMQKEVWDKILSLKKRPLGGLKIAVHYGCHYLKPSKVRGHESPETPYHIDNMVKDLGAEPVEYVDKLMCCGAGGGVRSGNSDEARQFTLTKIENARKAGADLIVHPCAFCHFQLDTGQQELLDQGLLKEPLPVILITQLIGLALGMKPEALGLNLNKIPHNYLSRL